MSHSVYSETRSLAGPILLLKTWGSEDQKIGSIVAFVLLPAIFAVGVWRHWLTIVLSILAVLTWIGFGLWLEVIASV
jgi:hypothetical protein